MVSLPLKLQYVLRIPYMPHTECSPLVVDHELVDHELVDRELADRELAKVICRHQCSMLMHRKRNLNTPLD